ncbi:AraC family transcriptional regulator [Urechidicola vernalis]|uniref:AraC family transcriptional regulator n=1 Tax=Urechidicola vernalis TaxID=3075600 RepID=A0ABU2Y8Z5_9FLAO|nr:AraC family transcriptional regulator [Urechidicola sp. P050]MDT0553543.1 AraC family transcriptional regulator [Urechidicola sp. P050]
MKVLPFKISKPENEAFIYQEDKEIAFYNKLHQHEEIQISFIKSGEGSLIIGDTITDYKTDDIIVIGSNLPHVFNSDLESEVPSFMMTLFFSKFSFGNLFFELNEFRSLKKFFKQSEYGVKLTSNKDRLKELFLNLPKSTKLQRFILLFEIMQVIIKSDCDQISSFVYQKNYKDDEGKRMGDIYDFTFQHFSEPITLPQIASVANMTTNAFCKYFKQRTNKTYFQLLTEVRIEHSCKLLTKDRDLSIAEIALQSGFQNISNFNRKFKSVKQMTPTSYKNR